MKISKQKNMQIIVGMFWNVFHVDEEEDELDVVVVERGCEFESKAWRHIRQHNDEGPGKFDFSQLS